MTKYALKADRSREPAEPETFFVLWVPTCDAFIYRAGDCWGLTTDWSFVATFETRGEALGVSGQLLALRSLLAITITFPAPLELKERHNHATAPNAATFRDRTNRSNPRPALS